MEKLEVNSSPEYNEIALELVEMAKVDQDMRNKGEGIDDSIDEKNTKRLKEVIEQIGWPNIPKVGRLGSSMAWLLAQHADLDLEFQKECLGLMKRQNEGDIEKGHIAYLEDRVRVNTGKPTLYGTQFFTNSEGIFGPRPIEDIEHLDERRAEYGLEPFEEYKNKMLEKYGG